MRKALLAAAFALLSACGNQLITKVDPDTGVCYMHDRQWIIWQLTNDVYRVESKECQP